MKFLEYYNLAKIVDKFENEHSVIQFRIAAISTLYDLHIMVV